MGFQQGLSGLNSSSKALDVVGNNVANANTVGFKSSRAEFADVYAATLSGAGGAGQVGIGTMVNSVAQQFTQGNINITNNSLDLAINGNGMYVMADGTGALSYTRHGQFHLDKDGYMVNAEGLQVQGYPASFAVSSLGTINSSTPEAIYIDPTDLQPQQTDRGTVGVNLDARSTVPPAGHEVFSPADPLSYNSSTSMTIYDSLGNVHTLSMYFVYAGQNPGGGMSGEDVSMWKVRYAVDGVANATDAPPAPPAVTPSPWTSVSAPTAILSGDDLTIQFDAYGNLNSYDTGGGPFLNPAPSLSIDLNVVVGTDNKALSPLNITSLDYTASTQFGTPFGVNAMTQDGYPSGRLSGVSVSPEGIIQGRYTNGQTRNMAQVVLARFTNPNGLLNIGGNNWQETYASGAPLVGAPGSSSNGLIQSSALEESNVDLTKELVDMITFQRAYQANAQTVKTQDSVMQTLVNLR